MKCQSCLGSGYRTFTNEHGEPFTVPCERCRLKIHTVPDPPPALDEELIPEPPKRIPPYIPRKSHHRAAFRFTMTVLIVWGLCAAFWIWVFWMCLGGRL